MAKFRPILGDLAGSIADVVFARNKGGTYARRRSVPTNPGTIRQLAARNNLAQLSSAWAGLTATQRSDWANWAAANPLVDSLGASFQRTAHQAYVGLGARVLGAGGVTAPPTPPVAMAPPGLVSAVITYAAGSIHVVYTATPLPAGIALVGWASLPGSAGQDPNFHQARLAAYSAAAAASPQDLPLPYSVLAGTYANAWVGVIRLADGQVSTLLKGRLTF